jgi:hypothetical protein
MDGRVGGTARARKVGTARSRGMRASAAALLIVAVALLAVAGCGGDTTARDDQLSPSERKWLNYIEDEGVPDLRKAMPQLAKCAGHYSTGAITGSVQEWNGGTRHLNKAVAIVEDATARIDTLSSFSGVEGKTWDAVAEISDDFIDATNQIVDWVNEFKAIRNAGPYAPDFGENMQRYSRQFQRKHLKKAMSAILEKIDAVNAQTQ